MKHGSRCIESAKVCNCVFFYFDTACLINSRSDGSHKIRNAIMHWFMM